MSVKDDLVTISREVGSDPEWVLAGGGNTSAKEGGLLFVKASGSSLSTITIDGFVRMEMKQLAAIWEKSYPAESKAREAQALADLMAARAAGDESKRPSVETLMHAFLPYAFVVHTHPAIVNGITCSREGKTAALRVFGDDVLWVPTVNPGYILAKTMKKAIDGFASAHGAAPSIMLLQNHGLVVAADSIQEIRQLHERIATSIRRHLVRSADFSAVAVDESTMGLAVNLVKGVMDGAIARFFINSELSRAIENAMALAPLMSPLSPDHIVYAGPEPLFIRAGSSSRQQLPDEQVLAAALQEYRTRLGIDPKIIVFQGVGAVAVGQNEKAVASAEALFLDALKVATYAESFGGCSSLPADQIEFIRTWEVETYRARQNL